MIKKMFLLILLVLIVNVAYSVSGCSSEEQKICAAKPVSLPGGKAQGVVESAEGSLGKLLDRIEQAGGNLKSFEATMRYEQLQQLIDTQAIRNGKLYYRTDKKSVQARIHFSDYLQQDLEEDEQGKVVKFDEDYVFDGLWVTRRNAQTKTIQRWEVSKKQRNAEAFRLGKGPFPLPFAIRKKDVLEHFDASVVEPDPNAVAALKDTSHLKLIPKKESSYAEDYIQLDLWVDQKTAIPRRISYEKEDYEITTVTWTDIKLDKKIKDKVFHLKKLGKGWTEEVTLLDGK